MLEPGIHDASVTEGDPDPTGRGELLFLPLGGAGEIGMNLNLYGFRGRWLMVDLGVAFGDDSMPGVNVFMPDPAFIVACRDALEGLVLTHAHEDHIGAVPYLWPLLKCPIYATPFAAHIARRKLGEAGLAGEAEVIETPLASRFALGPFDVELISLTHSIPEPNALAIRTEAGIVLHTGDWKIDDEPLVGKSADVDALRRLGDEGVLALVCDSTNALTPGKAGSEASVRDVLTRVVAEQPGRVAVTCFASNVARMDSIMRAAVLTERHPVFVGRSIHRMVEAARSTGYLDDMPPIVGERDAGFLPRDKVLFICTGSQGEPRAALPKIAADEHPHIVLERGDSVIFSSRVIPGNEKAIARLQNRLIARGVTVITDEDEPVHVSGHPCRDELTMFYQWVRPQIAVPVHGEQRHMRAHAALASDCQTPYAIVAENGVMVRLAPGQPEPMRRVECGRLAVEGNRLVRIDSGLQSERMRMLDNGAATVTIVVDANGAILRAPQVTARGVLAPDEEPEALGEIVDGLREAVGDLPRPRWRDDAVLSEFVRSETQRRFRRICGKRPITTVHLVRL